MKCLALLAALLVAAIASPLVAATLSASDAAALATADANGIKYRTATATLGGFTPNQPVAVNMTRNAFNFGLGAGSDQLIDKTASALILANANSITPRGGGYQFEMEPKQGKVDYSLIDRFNDFATKNKLTTRFHTVLYDDNAQAAWLETLLSKTDAKSKAAALAYAQGRLSGVLKDSHQHYGTMDLINEGSSNSGKGTWYASIGTTGIASVFNQAAALDPTLQAGVNNDHLLNGRFTDAYLQDVKALQAASAHVGELGIEDYLGWSGEALPTPTSIAANLAKLNATGLPSVLTEFGGFAGLKSPEVLMNQTLRMMFGNPQTTGMYVWTWVDTGSSNDWAPKEALYTLKSGKYSLTPAGQAWQAFIASVTTKLTVKADANGFVTFTGYLGDYNIGGKAFTLTKAAALQQRATPEPPSIVLAVMAFAALMLMGAPKR